MSLHSYHHCVVNFEQITPLKDLAQAERCRKKKDVATKKAMIDEFEKTRKEMKENAAKKSEKLAKKVRRDPGCLFLCGELS